jgi:hypothetical protein
VLAEAGVSFVDTPFSVAEDQRKAAPWSMSWSLTKGSDANPSIATAAVRRSRPIVHDDDINSLVRAAEGSLDRALRCSRAIMPAETGAVAVAYG